MTATYEWDGFALDASNGISITGEPRDDGPIQVKLQELTRGGMALEANLLRGRRVRLKGIVRGTDPANFEARVDALMAKLHVTGIRALRLSDDRYLDAYASPGPLRIIEGTHKDEPGAEWDCEFLSLSPYWRGASESTGSTTNSATTVSLVRTNAGDAPEYPSFEIENTGLSAKTGMTVTIRNATSSLEFRLFSFDLAAGDILVVDARSGQIYLKGTPDASSAAPVRVDGAWWPLAAGANTVEWEANDGSGALTYRISHYDRWHHFGDLG